eukprot:SAG31_NODE_1937_length_6866_cov_3.173932_8_plen_154_part_00
MESPVPPVVGGGAAAGSSHGEGSSSTAAAHGAIAEPAAKRPRIEQLPADNLSTPGRRIEQLPADNKGTAAAESSATSHIRHSATHPKFLHSNSTSHQWAFGAFAELVGEGCYFLVFVQLFEKYGTLIERNTALIEKVSPCRQCCRSGRRCHIT